MTYRITILYDIFSSCDIPQRNFMSLGNLLTGGNFHIAPLQAFTHIITDVKEDALVQAGLEEKLIIA